MLHISGANNQVDIHIQSILASIASSFDIGKLTCPGPGHFSTKEM